MSQLFHSTDKRYRVEDFGEIADKLSLTTGEDNSCARRRYKTFLVSAIAYLPAGQRQALVLHCLEGRTVREAGKQLGVAPSTISRRCAAAKRTLRNLAALFQDSGLFPA